MYNIKVKCALFCFLLFLILFSSTLYASEKVVTFGFDSDYPPFSFVANNTPQGYEFDMIKLIFEKGDYKLEIKYGLPWDDIYKQAVTNHLDICGPLVKTPERANQVDFTDDIYTRFYGVFTNRDTEKTDVNNLGKYRLGAVKGYYSEIIVRDQLKASSYEVFDTYLQMITALKENRIDAFIEITEVVKYYISKNNLVGQLILQKDGLFSQTVPFGISKKRPDLVKFINKRLKEIKASGEYEIIHIKNFSSHSSYYYDAQKRLNLWIIIGLIAASMFFIVLLKLRIKAKTKALVAQNIELQQSENRFRGIFEQAAVGVAIVGLDGKWLRVNNKLCEIVSYPMEELLNLTFQDITHPDDLDSDLEFYKKALEGIISTYTIEKKYIKKTGENAWISLTVSLVRDEKGSPDFFISVIDDISSRKLAEDARKESEKQYRDLLMNLQVGIVVHAPDTRILISNAAASKILGLSENQMLGKEAIDPEWKFLRDDGSIMPVEEYPVNLVRKAGQPLNRYVVGIRKNQTQQISWVLVSAYPSFFENNELQHIVVTFIDITELKQAETALLAEKERLAVTLRSIGDGVITTDTDGRITLMNKVAEELTGWKLRDSIGKPLDEVFIIINEKTRLACENPAHKIITTGNTIELENHTVLISRDGNERIIADSGAPILDKNSKIIGVVLVFRDMTEKQKIEDALQNALKLESLNILAGGIAHDFNNLLGGIFGFMDLALEYANDGDLENVKTSITDSMAVFERAKDLTMQLLTFAKGGDPVRKIGDIGKLVRDSVLFALTGSNVSISFDIPDCPFMCDFDKNQMGQVIDNMAINARQAMPMGGKLEVVLSKIPPYKAPAILPRINYIRISITDNGPGIPKENLPHIFDPFFTTKKCGTGLGLATCYSIIKRHDGLIEVETEESKGTTFHVYLPEASGRAETDETEKKTAYKGCGRILVMDDQESIIKVTSSMLTRLGYSVASASNGDEAIELVRQAHNEKHPFVAAILDLTIPGGRGGKDSVDEILDIDPSIKLVASSGYSGDSIMSNPSAFGFSACLIKPFRVSELTKALESLTIGI